MDKKEIFSEEVVQAILKRKKKMNKPVWIVSKMMKVYEMSEYTSIAEKLILEKDASDEFLKNHVTIDFMTGDIWLDEIALNYYEDILKGFIDSERYDSFLKYAASCGNLNRINNDSVLFYQKLNIVRLFKTMAYSNKFKKTLPEEVGMIKTWCLLELFSRTPFPKIYYFIMELPLKLKIKYTARRIGKKLLQAAQE